MSGIAGIIHFDGRPVEPGQIEAMTSAMDYRGPDGINHWTSGSVALGQCMLRTTPESLEETQPLTNEDASLVLVMDGRIDNWEELRRQLLGRGACLRSRADAELLLRAYETWGERCVEHIDGDFAFAIWNSTTQALFCGRDHIGAKPLFYHRSADRFIFASEPAAFRHQKNLTLTPNLATVAEYLTNDWTSISSTFWNEIVRLPQATAIRVTRTGVLQTTYWQPSLEQPERFSENDFAEQYLEIVLDVCRRMMRSQTPLAFEVSGGLDSSALFAVADRLEHMGALGAPGLHGFTLDFPSDGEANELAYVDAMSAHLQRPIEKIQPTVHGIQYYARIAHKTMDFPGYPNGLMAMGIRQRAQSLGCRTVFSGTGGDEWLGLLYEGLYLAEELSAGRLGLLRHLIRRDARELGYLKATHHLARYGMYPNLPSSLRGTIRRLRRVCKQQGIQPTLSSELQSALAKQRTESLSRINRAGTSFAQRLQLNTLHAAYDSRARESEERLAALSGLELRWIFHNRKLIQHAFSVPERFRSQPGMTKRIHRQAMRGFLPEAVRTRTDKADFMVTFTETTSSVSHSELTAMMMRRLDWFDPAPESRDRLARLVSTTASQNDQWPLWSLLGCDLVLQSQQR